MKIYETLKNIYSSQKRMVGRDTIDINRQHVCILTAIDRSNNIYVQPVSAGSASLILCMKIYSHALLVRLCWLLTNITVTNIYVVKALRLNPYTLY